MTLSADNRVVQGFWQGPITTMERLSMESFLQNGHDLHVFSYGPLDGVPAGVIVKDAREVMSESEAETFRCPAQLSDFFRIALLYKLGGWYVDLDTVCIQPFQFSEDFCFYRDRDESTISFAVSKAPAGSDLMRHCYTYLAAMSPEERSNLPWQAIGSDFACGAVEFFHLTRYAQPGYVFDPVQWQRARMVVDPIVKFDLSRSYAVHLFHAAWNDGPADRTGKGFDLGQRPGPRLDTDGEYHPDCLYSQLKRKYGL